MDANEQEWFDLNTQKQTEIFVMCEECDWTFHGAKPFGWGDVYYQMMGGEHGESCNHRVSVMRRTVEKWPAYPLKDIDDDD